VTLRIHLQAIGDDVLDDLVMSNDLDPAIPPQIARYELGGAAAIDWTPAGADVVIDQVNNVPLLCIVKPVMYRANVADAVSNARCVLPAPSAP
jgi:hypothetical protein